MPGFLYIPEPELIQTVVPELAIGGFNKRMLGRPARPDKVQPDIVLARSKEHRLASQFGLVVTNYRRWLLRRAIKQINSIFNGLGLEKPPG